MNPEKIHSSTSDGSEVQTLLFLHFIASFDTWLKFHLTQHDDSRCFWLSGAFWCYIAEARGHWKVQGQNPLLRDPESKPAASCDPGSSTPWPWNQLQSSPLCRSLPFTCHSWLQVQKSHSEAVAEDGSSFKLYTCICPKMYSEVGTCTQKYPQILWFSCLITIVTLSQKNVGGWTKPAGLAVGSCRWNQQWFQRMESTRRVKKWWKWSHWNGTWDIYKMGITSANCRYIRYWIIELGKKLSVF